MEVSKTSGGPMSKATGVMRCCVPAMRGATASQTSGVNLVAVHDDALAANQCREKRWTTFIDQVLQSRVDERPPLKR